MPVTTVLVTGATGAVGPRVVQALHQAGHRVRTFSLDAPPVALLPEDVEALIGDVTDPIAVQSAMQDVQAVIHLAALLHIVNPSPALRKKYIEINVGGTAHVIEAAVQAGVERVVLFSTVAVYGPTRGRVLTEGTPPRPDTLYAQTKLEAERVVLDATRTDGQPLGTVLRMGAIYGSRIKGNYRRLLRSLARGRFIPVGNGRNRRTLIYDRDAAGAAVLAAHHPAAAGEIFNVSGGRFCTLSEIIAAMCAALGRSPPRIALPVEPVRLAAGVLEDAAKLVGHRSPITRAAVEKFIEDVAVDSQHIQSHLNFVPQYDLKAGWLETVQEMRRAGGL